MKKRLGMGITLFGALAVAIVSGCDPVIEGGGGGSAGQGGGGSGALTWYTTCGDPVCMSPDGGTMPPAGVTPCTTEAVGAACTTEGATCWPADSTCGELLRCAKSDPKDNPGGCPISRVSHKKDLQYLSESEVASIAEEATSMRLSSWHYRAEGEAVRKHVGFLIDDMPESIAVAANGERVDLYGYTSMAIAAVQMQDKRLQALEKELAAMRSEVVRLRAEADRCETSSELKR